MFHSALILATVTWAQGLPPATSAPAQQRIVVMPIAASGSVDQRTAALLNEAYLTELARLAPAGVALVGASDISAVLDAEQQKQLAGCDEGSCLVDIGNALGAGHIIATSLGSVGGRYLLSTKFLAAQDATVRYRNTIYLGTSEAELVDGVRRLALELAAGVGWQQRAADASSGGPGLLFWSGVSVGAAGLLVAAVAGAATVVTESIAGDPQQSWESKHGAAQGGLAAIICTGIGGVLAAAGGGLAIAALAMSE